MNRVVISFVAGAGGRFIASIISYALHNANLDVVDSRGAAHNDTSDSENSWWLNNLDFSPEYYSKFRDEIGECESPRHMMRGALSHGYRNGDNQEVVTEFAKKYNAWPSIIKTHCPNIQLIQNIMGVHSISPLILQIIAETEEEYNQCFVLSEIKNSNTWRGPMPYFLYQEYTSLSGLGNQELIFKFPVRHLLNQDIPKTIKLITDVMNKLNSPLTPDQIVVINTAVVKYFDSQLLNRTV